jgi:hypothetical protein
MVEPAFFHIEVLYDGKLKNPAVRKRSGGAGTEKRPSQQLS